MEQRKSEKVLYFAMKFSVYRWIIQSLYTARMWRRKQAMDWRAH